MVTILCQIGVITVACCHRHVTLLLYFISNEFCRCLNRQTVYEDQKGFRVHLIEHARHGDCPKSYLVLLRLLGQRDSTITHLQMRPLLLLRLLRQEERTITCLLRLMYLSLHRFLLFA
ncbi:hypothetical protein BDZ97DRAFT_1772831 [Flammula alnicola]|nr:hypothetical protein BDZ97DRAFT_1772831 [Flammula alnicola]